MNLIIGPESQFKRIPVPKVVRKLMGNFERRIRLRNTVAPRISHDEAKEFATHASDGPQGGETVELLQNDDEQLAA